MNDLFQKLKVAGSGAGSSSSLNLSLAAFGKHPGWNDHFEGVGVDTEVLADFKRILYDDGIGGQINSGAWETLNPGKRLEGFDHTFLWMLGGRNMLGQLWSSSDGKGRSKYPMVLCVEIAGPASGFLMAEIFVELESLRGDCRATASAEQVMAECRAARDRMRSQFGNRSNPEPALPVASRQRFLEHGDFGPARLGLLRVLHELSSGSGAPAKEAAAGHLRVPQAGETRIEGLQNWAAFLQCRATPATSLLFIQRRGVNWVDIIMGKPDTGDFFCLQAAPQALPLTTEIPYELSPSLKPRLQEWEARFLGAEPPEAAAEGRASSGQVEPSHRLRNWIIGFGLVLLALIALAVFGPFDRTQLDPLLAFLKPADGKTAATKPNAAGPANQDAMLIQELKTGQAAFDRNDYAGALAQAELVLGARSTNAAAMKLKADAQHALELIAAKAALEQQKYEAALKDAQGAFDRKDFAGALAKADLLLGSWTNDPAAVKLKATAKSELDALALKEKEVAQQRLKFDQATNAATAALAQGNFAEATNQASVALSVNPDDAGARGLLSRAQQALAAATAPQPAANNAVPTTPPAVASRPTTIVTNNFGMQFVWVPTVVGGGAFVGKYEVTQRQYRLAMGQLPKDQPAPDDDLPVVNVSFEDATTFCNQLGKADGKHYSLPSKEEWLSVAGLTTAEAPDAWQILGDRGLLDKEVTGWKTATPWLKPAHGGSRGAQANGVCDLFGNVREWDAGKESTGFSYDANGSGSKKSLFVSGHGAKELMGVTGFRCIVR